MSQVLPQDWLLPGKHMLKNNVFTTQQPYHGFFFCFVSMKNLQGPLLFVGSMALNIKHNPSHKFILKSAFSSGYLSYSAA